MRFTTYAIIISVAALSFFFFRPAHHAHAATVYNVDNYGAYGDGVHDDTPAIQSAINAAEAAGGGTVYLPAGTYLLNSKTPLPGGPLEYLDLLIGSNVTLQGASMGSTELLQGSGGSSSSSISSMLFVATTSSENVQPFIFTAYGSLKNDGEVFYELNPAAVEDGDYPQDLVTGAVGPRTRRQLNGLL